MTTVFLTSSAATLHHIAPEPTPPARAGPPSSKRHASPEPLAEGVPHGGISSATELVVHEVRVEVLEPETTAKER